MLLGISNADVYKMTVHKNKICDIRSNYIAYLNLLKNNNNHNVLEPKRKQKQKTKFFTAYSADADLLPGLKYVRVFRRHKLPQCRCYFRTSVNLLASSEIADKGTSNARSYHKLVAEKKNIRVTVP